MPKVKKTSLPRKKKSTSTQKSKQRTTVNTGASTHEATLVGLTDPFSPEAANARYPDQGAGKTMSFQQRLAFSLTTDAGGAGAAMLTVKPNFLYLLSSSVSGNTVTWAGTYDAGGDVTTNLVNTYGLSFRPTSFGARIANNLGATDSSGHIIIAKGSAVTGIPTGTTFIPSNFNTWEVHPMVHGGEWHTVGAPRSASAYAMASVAGYTNTSDPLNTWDSIYVYVTGTKASTAVLYLELVVNFEFITKEDAIIAQLAEPQPVYNAPMITAINEVQSNHLPSHKGGQSVVRSFLKREAKKALVKHVIPFVAKKATALLV